MERKNMHKKQLKVRNVQCVVEELTQNFTFQQLKVHSAQMKKFLRTLCKRESERERENPTAKSRQHGARKLPKNSWKKSSN